MIHASVALSTETDSTAAALDTAGRLSRDLGGDADWAVAFCTEEHHAEVTGWVEALSSALGTPYVVGCSASGVLVPGHERERGPALGVLAVRSDQLKATPFLFYEAGDRGLTAGTRLGQRLLNSRGTEDVLVVWPDPYRVRPDCLLQGLDAVLGAVPVVGGACSTGSPSQQTIQFCGDESSGGAVSGLRLGGTFSHAIGITQGCRPLGGPFRVTRCHDNLLLELDGQPALDRVRQVAPAELFSGEEWAFHYLFVGLLPEEGAASPEAGEYLVRNILSADPDTGVVAIADQVEEGRKLLVVQREPQSARADLRGMLERVSPRQTGLDYRFGLYFNCLARGRSLYGDDAVDAGLIQQALPDVPLLGFFCNAEIGPLRGVNRLFTYTGVLLLVGE